MVGDDTLEVSDGTLMDDGGTLMSDSHHQFDNTIACMTQ
jgi:hypothetical protein